MLSLADVEVDWPEGNGPSVQTQFLLRFRRPATGVSGQESLSDSDESRLSPIRGPLGRGELSMDEKAELDGSEGDWVEGEEGASAEALSMERESSEASDSVVARDEMVEVDDSRSECATVYLTVVISSSSGVRKDTRFSAGNRGRDAILRGASARAGLLDRIEVRLWGCLYGITMVAESVEAEVRPEESVDAELGVEALGVEQLLSMQRRGREGRGAGVEAGPCS